MRITWLILVALSHPAFADEKAKSNTLTPKEIAGGTVLLFDGETAFGWTIKGSMSVKEGILVVGGEEATSLRHSARFGDFSCVLSFSTDNKNWSTGRLGYDSDMEKSGLNFKDKQVLGDSGASLEAKGEGKGPWEIAITIPARKTIYIKSLKLRPYEVLSLFNGTDLSGWKVYHPAKAVNADPKAKAVYVKSKYTVTKEGWLNVKDGPGDLQTEGQWADFVAQFECISNGKHLNSGLFFRAIPDQYQQGYEAQIRNEWEGDDRTKPVDFGTGAIYRRQKARKVISTDGEWFTMTVAAHGRHIATWVNGYQTVDWIDDRKENDNARNGFKKGKGALSIQGHDPTTDLSFRNIRIQSLDPK